MNAENPHPDPSKLRAFALGRLNAREMRALEAHLADCPTCVRVALTVPEDPLVRALRRPSARTGLAESSPEGC